MVCKGMLACGWPKCTPKDLLAEAYIWSYCDNPWWSVSPATHQMYSQAWKNPHFFFSAKEKNLPLHCLGSSHMQPSDLYLRPINALSLPFLSGLTTSDKAKNCLLDRLVCCDGGTGVMQSFYVDDPTFCRLYCGMFSVGQHMMCVLRELVLDYLDIR